MMNHARFMSGLKEGLVEFKLEDIYVEDADGGISVKLREGTHIREHIGIETMRQGLAKYAKKGMQVIHMGYDSNNNTQNYLFTREKKIAA
jgi:hypothetical protein